MAKTTTFAVTTNSPVTVLTKCRRVTIGENGQIGTDNFTVKQPTSSDTAVTYAAGKKVTFEASGAKWFKADDIIAYVTSAGAAMTFSQEEE